MINAEKIKLYNRYGGDNDGLALVGKDYEKRLFNSNDWTLINNFYHDIELINKRLAAQIYINLVFARLKKNCDQESFEMLTNKIECYKDFQEIADILRQIKAFTSQDANTVWAGFDNANEFLEELNHDIGRIENCNYEALEKIHVEFLPACTYQELSISNGWGENYIKLSASFDKIYERLTKKESVLKNALLKTKGAWWKRLFGN